MPDILKDVVHRVKNIIMANKILKENAQPLGNYPHLKRVGDFIYISGTSSRRSNNTHIGAEQNPDGSWQLDIELQTEAVIKNIESILQSIGADLSDVIDITTFLVDMKDFLKAITKVLWAIFQP